MLYYLPQLEYFLAICISLYGFNTVFSFAFSIPRLSKYDDTLVPYCAQNYIFWLLTSIIFFLFGIFLLTKVWLVYLMAWELVFLLSAFVWFLCEKNSFLTTKRRQLKRSRERKQNSVKFK